MPSGEWLYQSQRFVFWLSGRAGPKYPNVAKGSQADLALFTERLSGQFDGVIPNQKLLLVNLVVPTTSTDLFIGSTSRLSLALP